MVEAVLPYICSNLSKRSIGIPIPTQQTIWKNLINEAKDRENEIRSFLENETFRLYVDCKKLNNKEIQVVGILSSVLSIKIGIVICL